MIKSDLPSFLCDILLNCKLLVIFVYCNRIYWRIDCFTLFFNSAFQPLNDRCSCSCKLKLDYVAISTANQNDLSMLNVQLFIPRKL